MPGKEHSLITEFAINLLEKWEQETIDLEKDNSENAEASVEEEKTDDSKEEASDK